MRDVKAQIALDAELAPYREWLKTQRVLKGTQDARYAHTRRALYMGALTPEDVPEVYRGTSKNYQRSIKAGLRFYQRFRAEQNTATRRY